MSFTVLYAVFTLLVLVVIFGLTYKRKGLRIAFLATGITFVLSALFLVVLIYGITGMM